MNFREFSRRSFKSLSLTLSLFLLLLRASPLIRLIEKVLRFWRLDDPYYSKLRHAPVSCVTSTRLAGYFDII